MSKRRNPQDKARVVMEFFSTNIAAAGLCRRHNASPATFQNCSCTQKLVPNLIFQVGGL